MHGLDDVVATSWTRRVKEYFQAINQKAKHNDEFKDESLSCYFYTRDTRGEISVGKRNGAFTHRVNAQPFTRLLCIAYIVY